jgi:uncharacterized protein YdeI (BOF family)
MVLAVAVPAVLSQGSSAAPEDDWFWGPPLTCAQVFSGQFDDRIVVVEGKVGAQTIPQWNVYSFTDGTATINVNFGDEVPAAAIPKDTTVRIIGEADNGEVDVEGLQTLGTTTAKPNATVAQINSGGLDEKDVAVEGQIGDQDPDYPGWNYFGFSDGTGTTLVNLADELKSAQIPQNRTLMIFGQAKENWGTRELDSDLMLLAAGDEPEPPPPDGEYKIFMPLATYGRKTAPPPANGWVWGPPVTPVSQILAGGHDEQIVVVEGQIAELISFYPPGYKNFWFNDGSGRIEADFEDYVPLAAIPLNKTVRIIGDVNENNGQRKIDVDGLQTLGSVAAQPDATVAKIKAGDYPDETAIAVKGEFGNLVADAWNIYEFSDSTGTIDADLENKLSDGQVPRKRTLLLYGQAEQDLGQWKIDAGLMLVASAYGN